MTAVADYIAALDREHRHGDATEHSYRAALQALLESRGPEIQATNEPQQIAGNAPDFVVRRNATIIGHVEAKDIGEPLDRPGNLGLPRRRLPGAGEMVEGPQGPRTRFR